MNYAIQLIQFIIVGVSVYDFAVTSQTPVLTTPGNPLLYYYKFRITNINPHNVPLYQLSILLKTTLISVKDSHKITEFITAKQIFNI